MTKPTPRAIRELMGNPSGRPIPEETVKAEPVSWLPAPIEVEERGHAIGKWNELVPLIGASGVLTNLDSSALAVLCMSWADYMDAQDCIQDEGLILDSTTAAGNTTRKANPAVSVRNAAEAKYRSGLADFGLNPTARARMDLAVGGEAVEEDEFFGTA